MMTIFNFKLTFQPVISTKGKSITHYQLFITYFLGAISRFPLYLFCYGLRFAPAATKKDVVPIGARILVVIITICLCEERSNFQNIKILITNHHTVCHSARNLNSDKYNINLDSTLHYVPL